MKKYIIKLGYDIWDFLCHCDHFQCLISKYKTPMWSFIKSFVMYVSKINVHLSDPSCGVGSMRIDEINFRNFIPHVSHLITNKWGRVMLIGIGWFSPFFLGTSPTIDDLRIGKWRFHFALSWVWTYINQIVTYFYAQSGSHRLVGP